MKRALARKRITVLLAEDHTVVRQGLKRLLEAEGDIKVIGEAENGRQAVELAKKLRPAVVVMDIAMPLLNGLEATRQILKAVPGAKVLILSARSDDAYVEQVAALGAAGYLVKQASAHMLAEAVREVPKGNVFFSPSISMRLQDSSRRSAGPEGSSTKIGDRLSSREVEVLQLIAEGKSTKQVAAELGVSFKTADKHRQNLMNKLHIHDIAGLTRYAIAQGITEGIVRLTIR
ncbi:MAG: response regulator transcription factor [Verrucomicrobiota bacterium]|jgi:DNA-binding NarL/FixJ family response regulator